MNLALWAYVYLRGANGPQTAHIKCHGWVASLQFIVVEMPFNPIVFMSIYGTLE